MSAPHAARARPEGSTAAPAWQRILTHTAFEARILLGNGEQLLVAIVLPALLLIGLHALPIGRLAEVPTITTAVAATFATAIISTSFTSQGIQTGFDRRGGVLTWLATTPLGRSGYLAGKIIATLGVQVLQALVLGSAALTLGWRPEPLQILTVIPIWILGTIAFGSLALAIAGTLRTEAVLALTNTLFVLLVAAGGVAVPLESFPSPLAAVLQLLPSAALAELLRALLGAGPVRPAALAILLAWAIVGPLVVVRTFRWTSR